MPHVTIRHIFGVRWGGSPARFGGRSGWYAACRERPSHGTLSSCATILRRLTYGPTNDHIATSLSLERVVSGNGREVLLQMEEAMSAVKGRALVVDDDQTFCEMLELMLGK